MRMTSVFGVIAGIASVCLLSANSAWEVRFVDDQKDAHVEVAGLAEGELAKLVSAGLHAREWSRLLRVSVDGHSSDDGPGMMGRYSIGGGKIVFHPRFRLSPGLTYLARLDVKELRRYLDAGPSAMETDVLEARLEIPKPPLDPTTIVTKIYPSGETLPENLLKFYVHFSASMSQGESYERIQLRDASGAVIEDAFLGEELWDPERRRLTVLLDPGRIKRGLEPHEQQGVPLTAGRSYTLVIDSGWVDAVGNPLVEDFVKPFKTTRSDRTSPDPSSWVVEGPSVAGTDPVSISFGESLDHALLGRLLMVEDDQGGEINGRFEISENESRWSFYPTNPWNAGQYRILVDSWLEDLAGNNLGRVFDLDLAAGPLPDPNAESQVVLTFSIQ